MNTRTELASQNGSKDYVKWFRNAAPYINAHRGKTFVLMFGGEAVEDPNFANIIHDIALLNSLGVKLVLVHGARPQIEERLKLRNLVEHIEDNLRVTDSQTLDSVKDAIGSLRLQIEALLTTGLINSPMHGSHIRVNSGNFVIAKPLGIKNGVDYKHTGVVRRIDVSGINTQLHNGSIVLLSPVGYSPTGEVFNLSVEDVATQAAVALKADKLITFAEQDGLIDDKNRLIKSCDASTVKSLLNNTQDHIRQLLIKVVELSGENGIQRCHVISYQNDGALLQELFTRDGSGTLIAQDYKEQLRTATIEDVGGILDLIAPMEREGILVKRSRELLEIEIERFVVIEKEDTIIACAALYPYPEANCGELACVVAHPDYRGSNFGLRLLNAVEIKARNMNLTSLFVLTTVSAHWFREQGFVEQPLEMLPEGKQKMYNFQRKSKVFIKQI
ncbi:amino-acid N-acetyltransferase [Alteromonadaceae bacterium BrNp21-10]|nr:amino-acid N-acetyltransferase [Alteromonadaceae bacterium BrNp21-10]